MLDAANAAVHALEPVYGGEECIFPLGKRGAHRLACCSVPDHYLLPTQSNAVFVAIKDAGLDPNEFKWDKAYSRATPAYGAPFYVPVLIHGPSGSSFTFDIDRNGNHYAIFVPSFQTPEGEELTGAWDTQLALVSEWLEYLKREYQAPNLWAELGSQNELAGGELAGVENTPFTPDEQRQIEAQLRETKVFVRKSFELTEEQYLAIDSRLDYLVEASGRMGRVDWRTAFAGVFLTAIVTGVLPGDAVREIMGIALRGLAGLFGVDIPALPS